MKLIFSAGDTKIYRKKVEFTDIAVFGSGIVHEVCSTFVLAKEIEWASRLFVLEMKEADEEGIGTMLHIDHLSPAFPGEELIITAKYQKLDGNYLTCGIKAEANGRLVATGQTGQKIVKKAKLAALFDQLRKK
ncbi:MAG: hypothetical protein EOP53_24825 [Sphingobacteriales bacterium]|nr:MAG: hypothetical protein EOP53_24825 [Sphingobacteriales bacterium]